MRGAFSVAVVDDNATDRALIENMAREICRDENIPCAFATFESAERLLEAIRGGERFDILLLDVILTGMDGMDLASALRESGDRAAIIFISAHPEMALRGYEVSAARYLGKPLDIEKMREALRYCCGALAERQPLLLSISGGQMRLNAGDIVYAETWERGVRVVLTTGNVQTSAGISELAEALNGRSFVLCHRAYLVNLAHVRALRYCEAEMDNGDVVPVSKYRYAEVKKRYLEKPH